MLRGLIALALCVCAEAQRVFERNLAYSSPWADAPELSVLNSVEARHERLVRRQVDNTFHDEKYATFYGADFSNSPFVWNGGVNFTHSVASGDPYDTSVLLWTRAAPKTIDGPAPDQSVPICVSWRISAENSSELADSGEAFTNYDVDWTVKVEATNLDPNTKYQYQFFDCTDPETSSPLGSTRTLPSADASADSVNSGEPLKLAIFSCSQYQNGYFNAYGVATNNSADFYVHLGDYIYEHTEGGDEIGRHVLGRELATIHDYRQRLGQYRTDSSLVTAHQSGPWITVWDDHEVADNAWKAGTADSNDTAAGCAFSDSQACFSDRKMAAVRAYHEWMPIRQVDKEDKLRIWRNFQFGKLLDLTMLDTRQYDRDLTDVYYNTEYVETISAYANRSLMGFAQEEWFTQTLSDSMSRDAIWRVVGQQIVFTQIERSGAFDLDAWDGYKANRARVLDYLYDNDVSNTIILAGDSHANWVSDLARPNDTTGYNAETGEGAIGVEFAGTAVTSGSSFGADITPAAADVISAVLVNTNEDLQWSEGSYRGFFTLTIDPNYLNATYYAMNDTKTPNLNSFISAQFSVKAGENRLSRPVAGGEVKAGVLKINGTSDTAV